MKITLKGKWGFDSNLIVYSLTNTSPFYLKMTEFMKVYKRSEIQLVTTNQNILEAEKIFTLLYGLKLSKAISAVMDFINDFDIAVITPLPITIHQFHSYIEKERQFNPKNIFDTYLAFTYLDNEINQLLTNNEKDFKNIPNFITANPFKLDF